MARLLTISVTDLNKMKKDQLIAFIVEYQKQVQATGPWHTVDQIKSTLTPLITEASDTMQAQFKDLQAQLTDLKAKMTDTACSISDDEDDDNNGFIFVGSKQKSRRKQFSELVGQSVSSALSDERHKCDVIVKNAPESTNDNAFISDVCAKIGFNIKPTSTQRLGKQGNARANSDRPRLLKATFPSSFDARSFMASFEAKRKDEDISLPTIRLRSGKNKEELDAFRKSAKLAHNLNSESKKAGTHLSVSYSLRDNGDIWKFATNDRGAWKRVTEWHPSQESQSQGLTTSGATAAGSAPAVPTTLAASSDIVTTSTTPSASAAPGN